MFLPIDTSPPQPRSLSRLRALPLSDDAMISREPDGSFNENYCKWCYADGKFAYESKDTLLDFLVQQMPNPDNQPEAERRALYDSHLSQLKHWR